MHCENISSLGLLLKLVLIVNFTSGKDVGKINIVKNLEPASVNT